MDKGLPPHVACLLNTEAVLRRLVNRVHNSYIPFCITHFRETTNYISTWRHLDQVHVFHWDPTRLLLLLMVNFPACRLVLNRKLRVCFRISQSSGAIFMKLFLSLFRWPTVFDARVISPTIRFVDTFKRPTSINLVSRLPKLLPILRTRQARLVH